MSRLKPYKLGFLLLPDFSYFGLIAAIQPLFLANWRAQRQVFSWVTLSADGLPVRASNGSAIAVDTALSSRQQLQTLLVLACFDPKQHVSETRLRSALVRVAAGGVEMGGIETGSEVLAAAGLLDGRTAAVHWENLDGFRERYPKVSAKDHLYHVTPGRLTCAGGTAVIDMMLYVVARQAGQTLSDEVAHEMLVGRPRPSTHRQLLEDDMSDSNELVRAAIALMGKNLDEPLRMGEVARRLNVSRAHNLLEQTNLSVTEVAITSGFRSLEHFSRAYRSAFGCAPSSDRRQSITAPIHHHQRQPRASSRLRSNSKP
jgi:AraC family carnitine catabolism transcriptional activator